jgi:hypothetical protein
MSPHRGSEPASGDLPTALGREGALFVLAVSAVQDFTDLAQRLAAFPGLPILDLDQFGVRALCVRVVNVVLTRVPGAVSGTLSPSR